MRGAAFIESDMPASIAQFMKHDGRGIIGYKRSLEGEYVTGADAVAAPVIIYD